MPQPEPKFTFKRFASIFCDLEALAGVAILSYGFWLAWRPLGFIFGGLALLAQGILLGRGIAGQRRPS